MTNMREVAICILVVIIVKKSIAMITNSYIGTHTVSTKGSDTSVNLVHCRVN